MDDLDTKLSEEEEIMIEGYVKYVTQKYEEVPYSIAELKQLWINTKREQDKIH